MVTLQNLIEIDDTVLDGLECPEELDINALKSVVKMRLGLCYPTYDEPEVFKAMLTTWSFTHQWNMQHLIKANSADYAPLENYDRYEDGNETITRNGTVKDKNTETRDLTDKTDSESSGKAHTDTSSKTDNTSTNTVSAYNTEGFSNDNKTVDDGSGSSDSDTTTSGETSETARHTGTNVNDRDIINDSKDVNDRNIHTHGNIGVTTTQQMFESEIALVRGYNIYYEICNWIERDLFLQIY